MESSWFAGVTLVVAFLSQRAVAKCLEHDYEIQEYLTSSKPPWDNYFRISKSVYPSKDLPSLMIFITIKYVPNSTENATVEESKYTWSSSCLYVSAGPISMHAMNVFSLGAIWPNRRATTLNIKLPPLCPGVDEEETMTYFLSTLQDIADKPAITSPSLNTVECVIKDHGKATFSGFKNIFFGVCWSLLLIATIVGTVPSIMLREKLEKDCSSDDNNRKSEAWSIRFLLTCVVVVEVVIMISLFYNRSEYYILIYSSVWLTILLECLICHFCGNNPGLYAGLFFRCSVNLGVFIICHHLLWIFLGLITEPYWAFSILVATTSIFFVLYFLAWGYTKGYYENQNRHDCQSRILSLIMFLAFVLLMIIFLAVGQAFLSESLEANAIETAVVALLTAFVNKYATLSTSTSGG